MAHCPNCGNQVAEGERFCRACGHSIGREPPGTPTPAAATVLPSVAGSDQRFGLGYMPIKGRASALLWALGIGIGLSAIALLSNLAEGELLGRIAAGRGFSEAEANASDARQGLIGSAQLVLYVTTAVLWLRWFSRAYKNLPSLGAQDLRFKPGWAIGAWFVPFLNLVRPKAMTDDTWRASDPEAPPFQGKEWKGRRVNPILHWWWALFLISGILGRFILQGSFGDYGETIEGIRTLNTATSVSDFLDIPLIILAILVVREITNREETRARALL